MRTRLRQVCVCVCVLATVACGGDQNADITGPSGGNPPAASVSVTAADLAFCASETNRYRASVGHAALTQTADIDAYALRAAQADHVGGVAHDYFRANSPGDGAENMLLRWPHGNNLRTFIASGLAVFWAEGPGGGHYENIRNPRWRRFGCGIHVAGSQVTLAQEFRP